MRDATEVFSQKDVGSEDALTTSRSDKLISERRSDNTCVGDRLVCIGRFGRALKHSNCRVCLPIRVADQPDQSVRKRLRRRVLLRPYLVAEYSVVDRNEPALA